MSSAASQRRSQKVRIRSGIWFAVAVAALLGLWFGGNELYYRLFIASRSHPRLEPAKVNLIGVQLKGEGIIVSNGIARIVKSQGGTFGKPKDLDETSSGTVVPMKGLVAALRLEPDGVSELVTALADIKYEILPAEETIWQAKDIRAALNGDKDLRKKLEYALSATLEGGMVDRVNLARINSGIAIKLPVPVRVPSPDGLKTVEGTVTIPFTTRLAKAVSQHPLIKEKLPQPETVRGVYEDVAKSGPREDVGASLSSLVSEAYAQTLARPVEEILSRVVVLVTERQITGAEVSAEPKSSGSGSTYTITLDVTEDARDRLWQYSHDNPGAQLLLVSNGIAIAAPFIQHEMKYSTVAITNIADEDLAREAVEFIRTQNKQEVKN